MRLEPKFGGPQRLRGMKIDGGAWWFTNGHVLARNTRWERSTTLDALCEFTDGWEWPASDQSGNAPVELNTRQSMQRVLNVPATAVDGTVLKVLYPVPSTGLLAVVLRVGNVFKAIDRQYALPFSDCEWKTEPDARAPLYAFSRGGELVGVVMPLWLADELQTQSALLLEVDGALPTKDREE